MSLLEKAGGGHKKKSVPLQARTSLFTRAMAATREEGELAPTPEPLAIREPIFIPAKGMDELGHRVASIPPSFDSILSAWSIITAGLPLAAIALFLPQDDFLSLAARSGFPSGTAEPIPFSLAPPSQKNGEMLSAAAKALIAPLLGVDLGMDIRATAMWSDVGLAGLWIYRDASLEASPGDTRSRLNALLAQAADSFPASRLALPESEPVTALLEQTRKYRYATAFRFELGTALEAGRRYRGLTRNALRSAFLSACGKILARGGAAIAYDEAAVVCALGSSSLVDSELALFQFTKTLRRTLPFIAGEAFPEGEALGFLPASDQASEELSRFLSA
jgi:hypothetical protein